MTADDLIVIYETLRDGAREVDETWEKLDRLCEHMSDEQIAKVLLLQSLRVRRLEGIASMLDSVAVRH